jgi:uncharacterized protein (DUF1697 family)
VGVPPSACSSGPEGACAGRVWQKLILTVVVRLSAQGQYLRKWNETVNTHVAFLRGINVGGNTMISMKDLAAICTHIGLENVRTYLNSGNVLFQSPLPEAELQRVLETAISGKTGKEIGVIVRSPEDLGGVVRNNPFPEAVPSQVGVLLVTEPVAKNILAEFVIPGREKVVPGKREVYVHYPDGMGHSKLKWPLSLRSGTMRNINTLAKLVGLAGEG